MRKTLTIIGSKTFDAICNLYSTGKIEIIIPNHALDWLPLEIKDPKVKIHVVFNHLIENKEKKKELK
jgi:hypothetical protein